MKTPIPVSKLPYEDCRKVIDLLKAMRDGELKKTTYTLKTLADAAGAVLDPKVAEEAQKRPDIWVKKVGTALEFVNIGPELKVKADMGAVKVRDKVRVLIDVADEELRAYDVEGLEVSILFMTKRVAGVTLKISRERQKVDFAEIELK